MKETMKRLLFVSIAVFGYVSSYAQCELDLGQDTVYFCEGECVNLDVGPGWAIIEWSTQEITQSICATETGWHSATVEDALSCMATDSVLLMQLRPTLTFSDTTLCPDQVVDLSASLVQDFVSIGSIIDTTFLPDGSNDNYETNVLVTSYLPGETFQGSTQNQQLEICAAIEHSYLGDLEMMLTCPNGTSMALFNSYNGGAANQLFPGGFGGGGVFLGDALDGLEPGIGIPWDYCFSDLASWGTMGDEFGQGNFVTSTIDPSNSMAPGTYLPEHSFDSLVGCPMNGTWTITIRDNLLSDDGYISFWGIGISNELGDVVYNWSNSETTSDISLEVTEPQVWVEMTVEGVTCTDTADFSFHPIPEIQIGFDHADCNEATGEITNQTNPLDSVLMEIYDNLGLPIPPSLLDAGLYDVSLISPAGCTADTTIEIIEELDSVENITGATVVFTGQQFTYSVPFSECLTYAWTIDNGTIVGGQGTNEVQVTWNDSISGWISVNMNETRDFSQSITLYVGSITGIEDLESNQVGMSFFNEAIKPYGNFNNAVLEIVNTSGQSVFKSSVRNGEPINCSFLSSGIYTAILQSEKKRSVLKFAVTR